MGGTGNELALGSTCGRYGRYLTSVGTFKVSFTFRVLAGARAASWTASSGEAVSAPIPWGHMADYQERGSSGPPARPTPPAGPGVARGRLRDTNGQAVVELAPVVPVLILLGILDFGRAFNYQNDETHLANEAVRYPKFALTPGLQVQVVVNGATYNTTVKYR